MPMPSPGLKLERRFSLQCNDVPPVEIQGEVVSWSCHLSFDFKAKYVQISKVLTLCPLSPISFLWDQRGSLITDYLSSILWPSWHPNLLSAHRYTEVQPYR